MDLFEKCRTYTIADEVKRAGLYPYFHPINANEGPEVVMEGRKIIMAGSNNYLGLTAHPKVKEAAKKALDKYGTGCSGSRFLTGTLDLHIELENKIAKFLGKESCLLYSTGFQTPQGIIPVLVAKGELIFSDRDNHASINAGNLISSGMHQEIIRYKHNNIEHLENLISKHPIETPKLIVSDGVFSTNGEIANLPSLVSIAKKYNAKLLIDDAHAFGVIGKNGRGTASYFNLIDDIDLTFGTFSKSLASLGGYVVGPESVINFLKHNSPSFIFSASPTPSSVAAALASLEIIETEPEIIERLHKNVLRARNGFASHGIPITGNKDTAIVSITIGDTNKTLHLWRELYDAGIFVNVFVRPGVMPGHELLRTSYMATHENHHIDKIVDTIGLLLKKNGLANE